MKTGNKFYSISQNKCPGCNEGEIFKTSGVPLLWYMIWINFFVRFNNKFSMGKRSKRTEIMGFRKSLNSAKLLSLLSMAIIYSPGSAQNIRTVNRKNSFWSEVNISGSINKHLSAQFDIRYRRQSDQDNYPEKSNHHNIFYNPYQTVFRPWIHYYPKENHRLRISISPVGFWSTYTSVVLNEKSFFQFPEYRTSYQISYTDINSHRLTSSYQLRYELRWIGKMGNYNLTNDKSGFDFMRGNPISGGHIKQRLRILYKAEVAIKGNTIDSREPYIGFGEEIHIGLNKEASQCIDQNRLAFVIGYKYSDKFRIEVGYLNQRSSEITYSTLGIRQVKVDLNHALQLHFHFDNFQKYFHKINKS